MPLVAELQHRRVFRALIGYGIAAFAVLQIVEPVMHGLHWPDAVLSYLVVALAAGFPLVVGLAWIFDVRAGRIEKAPPSPSLRGTRLALVLVGIGLLAALPGLLWFFVLPGRAGVASRARPSIAVLPFADMSPGKDQEYFSDGVAEEILDALAQIDGLHVAGRTSSFSFKGKSEDLRSIGEKLAVAHILEGSIRKEGNRVRITAQLVSAADGYHVWSKTFDRELTGVFAIQEEISRAVVDALKVRLMPGEKLRQGTASPEVHDPEAHDAYLKGRFYADQRNVEALKKSLEYFKQSIQKEPGYALAYVGIASAYGLLTFYGGLSPKEAIPREKEATLKALELNPSLAEAHVQQGYFDFQELNYSAAEKEFRRAIELSPTLPMPTMAIPSFY